MAAFLGQLAVESDQMRDTEEGLYGSSTSHLKLIFPSKYGLWPPACDSIVAVAFPARGERRDIVVIGNCLGASDEQPQPLVYRAGADGYTLDADLSTDLMGVGTIKQVEQRMRAKIPQG